MFPTSKRHSLRSSRIVSSTLVATLGFAGLGAITQSAQAAYVPVDNALCATAHFAGGDGSESSPFQISNQAQLANVRNCLNGDNFFTLTSNILLSGTWTPIGEPGNSSNSGNELPFRGTFNGDGKVISGLNVVHAAADDTSKAPAGLFGLVGENTTIKNVTVYGSVSNANQYTGGVVGHMYSGTLENVTSGVNVTVTGSGNYYTGGLVGYIGDSPNDHSTSTQIIQSASTGSVTSSANFVGGLAGVTDSVLLTDDRASGRVQGVEYVGGLVGDARSGYRAQANQRVSQTRLAASGNVFGTSNIGGLIGHSDSRMGFTWTHASGDVTSTGASDFIGGLIGQVCENSDFGGNTCRIQQSFATGNISVEGAIHVGGLVGLQHYGSDDQVFATGNITGGREKVGGLIGTYDADSQGGAVFDSFASGNITLLNDGNCSNTPRTGGLIGENPNTDFTLFNTYTVGTVINCGGTSENPYAGNETISTLLGSGLVTSDWAANIVGVAPNPAAADGQVNLSVATSTQLQTIETFNGTSTAPNLSTFKNNAGQYTFEIAQGWSNAKWGICSTAFGGRPFPSEALPADPCLVATLTQLDVTSGADTGGTLVTVTGTNFVGGASIIFGGVEGSSYSRVSDTSATVVTPAHDAGTVSVQYRSPDGRVVTLADAFTFTGASGEPTEASIGGVDNNLTTAVGQIKARLGGVVKPAKGKTAKKNLLNISSCGSTLTLSSFNKKGKVSNVAKGNKMTLLKSGKLKVAGSGYKPNVKVKFFVYPGKKLIGTLKANAAGKINGKISIPKNLKKGKLTLQINGISKSKRKILSIAIGVAGA